MTTRISQLTSAATLTGTELVELSQLSASVTKTATTISADSTDNSFNDSGNGFVTAGFTTGKSIKVSGFTGNVANNIVSGVVTSVTAGKIIIGGTDGDVIVTDAAGESVTIIQWDSRRSTVQDVASMANAALSINTQTASYTLVIGDAGKYVRMNVGSANDLTVPPNSSVAFSTGAQVHVRQVGAGQTTVVAGSGVTITTPETLKLRKQHATATLVKVATDTWELMGDLEAV